MNPKITYLETQKIATVSCKGVAALPLAFEKLISWAIDKNLMHKTANLCTVYLDSFRDTVPSEVRMKAGIFVSEDDAQPLELYEIPSGKYIIASLEIEINEFAENWQNLFKWMLQNGHKKSNLNPFEVYHNNFQKHPQKLAVVDFCIPIL